MRLVQDNGSAIQHTSSPALIKLLLRARRWWKILREGELDITQLAAAESVMPAYITRVVRLAFLSPAVTDAILKSGVRAEVNPTTITAADAIPRCWKAQARTMLPDSVTPQAVVNKLAHRHQLATWFRSCKQKPSIYLRRCVA